MFRATLETCRACFTLQQRCKNVRHLGRYSTNWVRSKPDHKHRLSSMRFYSTAAETDYQNINKQENQSQSLAHGPGLGHFIQSAEQQPALDADDNLIDDAPYITKQAIDGQKRRVHMEVYGCQMNVNDTEVAWAILQENGFVKATDINKSDVILVMTCSIRDGAERKIWNRLNYLKHLKSERMKDSSLPPMKIGILGCMAERLKKEIIEKEQMVDLICGPDAYRDLPRMLAVTETGQAAVNVLLSLDETYADVMPVRLNQNSPSAFVSIMRGCDNMCTYCIVPFTRGRERSREISSILEEVRKLSDQGIKEVTLLGQNVNSYRDLSESAYPSVSASETSSMSKGFKTVYKPKKGGRRFSDLLERVSEIDPEMRIRFTSPHPKDFPDEVLHLINEKPNICKQIHLPAQSGSTAVLESMRRGYSRETYLELVDRIRSVIPGVSLSSDFISGFCGETDEDHRLTVDLIKQVKYNFIFCFPYSMRKKTAAYHRLKDDVPEDVKAARHMEVAALFRQDAECLNQAMIGERQLVLIEGTSKRSKSDLAGRNEGNTKVVLPRRQIPCKPGSDEANYPRPGDFVVVEVTDGTSQTLKGRPLFHSSIQSFPMDSLCYS